MTIISHDIDNCPDCGRPLIHSGRVKPMAPPLEVMICKGCDKEFWRRETECK